MTKYVYRTIMYVETTCWEATEMSDKEKNITASIGEVLPLMTDEGRLAVEEQGHPTAERPVWTDFIR